ncbi:MAG TPA: cation:proton antiporter [Bacteroidales bacterium]|nr:cation:proton antiporter [Bacteroidales bacterium]
MDIQVIVFICLLLLLSYLFDISSARTRIPSVILLLFLGWIVRQTTIMLKISIPDLNPVLPVLGTIGLILIVLEGALELEINMAKVGVIGKALLLALIPMLLLLFVIAGVFYFFQVVEFKTALLNALPFCVISSAIAIPSVRNLSPIKKELVIYESSFSDIIGVLLFNFIAINNTFNGHIFFRFGSQLIVIVIGSFILVLMLSFLLSRISHHITYTPIILLVILIYAVSKQFHLPGLIFILVFGLFLGNTEEFKRFKIFEQFRPQKLEAEVVKFKDITYEVTFLVRSLFFLLFGYLMETEELLDLGSLPWSCGIVISIYLIRWVTLKVFKLPATELLFVAPRGLITILLFISILPDQRMPVVGKSLVIQTIVLSVLVMMFGLMLSGRPTKEIEKKE